MQEIHSCSLQGSLSLMAPPGNSSSPDLAPNAFDSFRCQNHLWVIHPNYPWKYQKNILQLNYKLFKRNKLCLLTFGSRKLTLVFHLHLCLYCSSICLLDDESDTLAPSELCSDRKDLSLLLRSWARSQHTVRVSVQMAEHKGQASAGLGLSFPPPLRNVASSWGLCEQKNNLIWQNLLFLNNGILKLTAPCRVPSKKNSKCMFVSQIKRRNLRC